MEPAVATAIKAVPFLLLVAGAIFCAAFNGYMLLEGKYMRKHRECSRRIIERQLYRETTRLGYTWDGQEEHNMPTIAKAREFRMAFARLRYAEDHWLRAICCWAVSGELPGYDRATYKRLKHIIKPMDYATLSVRPA